ncbi:ead/Ea22-like family protein [Escherichia coli]
MTDITELAQSLKAAAIDAKELAIIARYSKGRAAAEKFYALANPNNVIALVEALEKAQSKADVYDMLRDDYGLREKGVGLADFVDWQAKHITELESRIVTVKLPKKNIGWDREEDDCWNNAIDACAEVLDDAGIKVEAE